MMDWKPIATAKKDGSYIIAGRFRPSGELVWVKHSRWMSADDIASCYGGSPEDYDAGWADGEDEDEPCYPTHWMPLPEPPQ